MIIKIEAKKNLYVVEWQTMITNDCKHDIAVELGHSELMVRTITFKENSSADPISHSEQ